MALNNAATLVVNTAHYFHAPVGTSKPSDLAAPGGDWEEFGHTDAEEILGFTSEGGDVNVLATLQNRSLRTSRSPLTESWDLNLQQWDEDALKFYYGANAATGPDGALRVPDSPIPTRRAFLAVFWDGENIFPIYAPSSEIGRNAEVEIGDAENLATLPLSIQPLNYEGNTWPYEVGPLQEHDGDAEAPGNG